MSNSNNNNNHEKAEYLEALAYHKDNVPGKIAIVPTKALTTQRDLALAYSPWVSAPCKEIAKNPEAIYDYTAKGNLVAVISNGTAILGLGNLGPAASKPVMEGKAVLFKKFADINAIDLEVDTEDPEVFINVVRYLGHSFGGINLEDIKAPECFIIENRLKELMDIPVFHDDQHGTAIITAAALLNSALLTKRDFSSMKIVVSGAGAASIACLDLIVKLGAKQENIILCDTKGVIYKGRKEGMNQWKEKYATNSSARSLSEAVEGADVFLGLSAKGAMTKEMVAKMAKEPIIFAMANPEPEILPEEVREVRNDAIIATGRSDFPNQVNNVMGFPYIFRGALDVKASQINDEMKIAAAKAIANLAKTAVPDEVFKAYPKRNLVFSKEYIIPVPFDPRLISIVPVAVAEAAINTGVAKVENFNLRDYKKSLSQRLNPAFSYMSFLFNKVMENKQLVVFADGEHEEVLKGALTFQDEEYGRAVIIGRKIEIEKALHNIGVSDRISDLIIVNSGELSEKKVKQYIELIYSKLQREGYRYLDCEKLIKSNNNILASCMLICGDVDAAVTGYNNNYFTTVNDLTSIVNKKKKQRLLSYSIILSEEHNLILADSNISEIPQAQDLVEIVLQIANVAKDMGIKPRIALVSFSDFGNHPGNTTLKIKEVISILDQMQLDFEYEGEITAEAALSSSIKEKFPFCRLSAPANILVMPGLNSAIISMHLLQELSKGVIIGPILDGFAYSAQVVRHKASASEILQSAVFAAATAIKLKKEKND